jgi:hypothetical protein
MNIKFINSYLYPYFRKGAFNFDNFVYWLVEASNRFLNIWIASSLVECCIRFPTLSSLGARVRSQPGGT